LFFAKGAYQFNNFFIGLSAAWQSLSQQRRKHFRCCDISLFQIFVGDRKHFSGKHELLGSRMNPTL
jgi:hypothetical protein